MAASEQSTPGAAGPLSSGETADGQGRDFWGRGRQEGQSPDCMGLRSSPVRRSGGARQAGRQRRLMDCLPCAKHQGGGTSWSGAVYTRGAGQAAGILGIAVFKLTRVRHSLGNKSCHCVCACVRKMHRKFWKRCVLRPGRMGDFTHRSQTGLI